MSTTMLYKKGTMINLDGQELDYIIVEDKNIEKSIKEGWVKHPSDVKEDKKVKKQNGIH